MRDLTGILRTRATVPLFTNGTIVNASLAEIGPIVALGQGIKYLSFSVVSALAARAGTLYIVPSNDGINFPVANALFTVVLVAGVAYDNFLDLKETAAQYIRGIWAPTGGIGSIYAVFGRSNNF